MINLIKKNYRNRSTIIYIALLLVSSNLLYGLDNTASETLTFPLRGAFYYPWYPQTWTVGGEHVKYNVELGYYSSDDSAVVDQHIRDMDYAKIDVAIASWWGIDRQNQANRIPMLLNQTVAAGSDLKWAIYYEMEGFSDPNVDDLKSDLTYLMENYADHAAFARINGKPVIFVYNADDNSCEVTERWAQAANGEWYVNLKVFGGFRNCTNQPDSWHQYGPASSAQQHSGYSYVISPGFWRADMDQPLLLRNENRWKQNVRDMIASAEPWQLITTYNEWGEGTAVERCLDWQSDSDFGVYLDALHYDGEDPNLIEKSSIIPAEFYLSQNIPNPFNPSTVINYQLTSASQVELIVFDGLGRRVETLVDGFKTAGNHSVSFGDPSLTSGIYYYQLRAENYTTVRKMLMIR